VTKFPKIFGNLNPQKIANLKVALLCFLAAATFWVLNALNKDNYTTVVDYPIEFSYDQEEFMPVAAVPERIKVEINGNGWDLLRKYFKINETPFQIAMENPSSRQFLLTSEIRRALAESITPINLVSIVTDTVTFDIDRIVARKVKVEIDTNAQTLANNYRMAGEISIEPSVITIKGPTSKLEQLEGLYKIALGESKINKSFNKILPLELPQELEDFLSIEEQSVHVRFDVYQMLEGNKRLKLAKQNFPRNAAIVDEPSTIIMTYLIDERKADELKNYEFEAVVNYNRRDREDSTLMVDVKPKPAFLENIQFNPQILKLRYENK
jgi:YbbR domain-containing protein